MQHEYELEVEVARDHGRTVPTQEWMFTPFDTWHRNPFYTGTPGRHPEDDNIDCDKCGCEHHWGADC